MKAFMGRLGVPSALSVWEVSAVLESSEKERLVNEGPPRATTKTYLRVLPRV